MTRAWLGALIFLMLAGTSYAGNMAADFNLPTASATVRLSQFKGKVVYLDFWASWCEPCKHSFPWMNEMQKKYRADGLEVVAINLDKKRELANKFLKEMPASFNVAFDPEGKTAESYNVMGMPSSYLINRKGEIVSRHIGFKQDKAAELEAQIVKALQKK